MSRIRSKNTLWERRTFSYLRKNKIYFQRHYRRISGNPDIAIPSKKKAVFIDGDFWHGWRFDKEKSRLPEVFWIPKIEANIKRDRKNRGKLRKAGWQVLRVWEHEFEKGPEKTFAKIANFLLK